MLCLIMFVNKLNNLCYLVGLCRFCLFLKLFRCSICTYNIIHVKHRKMVSYTSLKLNQTAHRRLRCTTLLYWTMFAGTLPKYYIYRNITTVTCITLFTKWTHISGETITGKWSHIVVTSGSIQARVVWWTFVHI